MSETEPPVEETPSSETQAIDDDMAAIQQELDRLQAEQDALAQQLLQTQNPTPAKTAEFDVVAQAERDGRSVHISNVDYSVSEEDLKKHFSDCGDITSVTIPKNAQHHPKGYAYMEFVDQVSVAQALLFSGTELKGRIVTVAPKRTNIAGVSRGRGAARSGYTHRGPPRGYYPPPPHGYYPPHPGHYPPGPPPPSRGGRGGSSRGRSGYHSRPDYQPY